MLTDQQSVTVEFIGAGFGAASLGCSLLTIFLIVWMKNWNAYLMLTLCTVICQAAYDINYIIGIEFTLPSCIAWHFLDIFGGLSVAILTNIVSGIILYVVLYVESVNIFYYFPHILAGAVGMPLLLAVLEVSLPGVLVETDDNQLRCTFGSSPFSLCLEYVYYWGRLLSIVVNFVIFGCVSVRLRRMAITGGNAVYRGGTGSHSSHSYFSSSRGLNKDTSDSLRAAIINRNREDYPSESSSNVGTSVTKNQSQAISALADRMRYYPLVQALCRSGAAWNEFDSYRYSTFPSAIMAGICSPSTGACYFVVFLVRLLSMYNFVVTPRIHSLSLILHLLL